MAKSCFEHVEKTEQAFHVPFQVDGVPVGTIGAKAFLSRKGIRTLFLPPTVERIGDWAFSHMKDLQEITIPANRVYFGKQSFLGCDSLQKIWLCKPDLDTMEICSVYEGIFTFLAAVVKLTMPEPLWDLQLAGDEQGQRQWLSMYDEALLEYLKEPDDARYVPAIIGWFDVEDLEDQKARFAESAVAGKVLLAFQRLLYDKYAEFKTTKFLQEYLLDPTKIKTGEALKQKKYAQDYSLAEVRSGNTVGLELDTETRKRKLFREILKDMERLGDNPDVYVALKRYRLLDAEDIKWLLNRLPENSPEVRALLLGMQLENTSHKNFFEDFTL